MEKLIKLILLSFMVARPKKSQLRKKYKFPHSNLHSKKVEKLQSIQMQNNTGSMQNNTGSMQIILDQCKQYWIRYKQTLFTQLYHKIFQSIGVHDKYKLQQSFKNHLLERPLLNNLKKDWCIMEENNYILDEPHSDGSYQMRLKIKYLQDDKQKLEISNKQMNQHIKLLREINQVLSKIQTYQEIELIKKLQQQNTMLQASYSRIIQENNALSCRNLMLEQINQESQTEYRLILKEYESKIIQLRLSIQFKESCIQSYEQKNNFSFNGFDIGYYPPSNFRMAFFNEIDQFKNIIAQLEQRNQSLQSQVLVLKGKNILLEEEKTSIYNLMASREGFNQLRLRMSEQRMFKKVRVYSDQKVRKNSDLMRKNSDLMRKNSDLMIKTLQNQTKKQSSNGGISVKRQKQAYLQSQGEETRQISYECCEGDDELKQVKSQLRKWKRQLSKLMLCYREQRSKRRENDEKIRVLVESNNFYKQKGQFSSHQVNYYKRATADLLTLVKNRRIKRKYSVDRSQVQKMIDNLKKPLQIEPIPKNINYWIKIQQQLNYKLSITTKVDLQAINRNTLRKSFSDILNFPKITHDKEKLHTYCSPNQIQNHLQIYNKIQPQHTQNHLDDFSIILQKGVNGDLFDDQTSIIKPKVVSYAERKKNKKKTRILDAHYLTIIRQNVL